MKSYLFRRILYLLPVMLGVSIITFALINLAPGDPAEIILRADGMEPTAEAVAVLREELGLNDPLYIQYGRWLWGVLHLDLGESFRTGRPVAEELFSRLPATLELTCAALVFMVILAVPAGILSALYRHTLVDHLGRLGALAGASLPGFWLGLVLIYLFSVKLGILPVMGRGGLEHLVLPAVTLGFGMAAVYARVLRTGMLDVLGQDYIKVARAKGLKEKWVIGRHALKNALLPAVTLLGMSFGHLLGGAVIVETIFAWPGVGKFAVESIFNRDYPVIQGYALFMAVVFVLANLLVDISYVFLDPRIRLERGE
ncbi:nickel ABC transporter permease [Candidatus Desulforudis audaxviator]|uniref:Nickel import system permease protein NikB n=1 Tax=Desulforudis audaxviator (strain MP104C) TaxID=477974 RepID=B1I1X7_DESAP|nr:nickel ABC transporter permease [Candidatus Desulforudis audaxviator]ACA58940.1 binding-protein-dependent transport systems inner membrane component [Candidatus Desulforudis audaxviator MP104C]AZK58967.1 ABC-type transporter, integral membrane subunit [Candidatus Desulforudis audaxviator]